MRLIIVTGQEGTDVENLLRRIISENKYTYDDAPKMVFPERSSLLYHPRSLYSNVRRVVSNHIDSNEDLFVATFSDYAMYGIRAEVRLADFEGAKLYQIKSDGEVVISEIDSNGKCQYINGVFDVLRDALNDVLGW